MREFTAKAEKFAEMVGVDLSVGEKKKGKKAVAKPKAEPKKEEK